MLYNAITHGLLSVKLSVKKLLHLRARSRFIEQIVRRMADIRRDIRQRLLGKWRVSTLLQMISIRLYEPARIVAEQHRHTRQQLHTADRGSSRRHGQQNRRSASASASDMGFGASASAPSFPASNAAASYIIISSFALF